MDDEVCPSVVEAAPQVVIKLFKIIVVDIDSRKLVHVQVRFVTVQRYVVRPAKHHVGVDR